MTSAQPVLMITPRWRRDGGVATHVIASATALAARGVEVHVAASIVDESERPPGVRLHLAPGLLDTGLAPEQRLGGALEAARGVVHMHQFEDLDVAGMLARRAAVALSVHGYSACTSTVHYFRPGQECPRAHGPLCVPNLLLRGCAHTRNPTWLPRSYRQAARAQRLLREVDLAITYSAVIDRHVAANGARNREILPLFATLEPAPRPPAAAERPRRILYAGRVVGAKGLDVLLRAMRTLDAELVVCGDGHELARMRTLAQRTGIAARVSFRGWLPPAELARELASAAVVAVPSLWPEPFGLVGLEAFGAGTPVVASATGGIPDWLHDGVTGIAVPPGDDGALAAALSRLLDDPAERERLGTAGRELVAARFTAERHVDAALAAYERGLAVRDTRGGERAAQQTAR
jgi:glycosyltransferase involved in cell wall biosynthesis